MEGIRRTGRPGGWLFTWLLPGAFLALPVHAHEFWIQPAEALPAPGSVLRLHLFVGDGLDQGKAYARNPDHMRHFTLWQDGQTLAVQGLPGWKPAGVVKLGKPGLAIAGYASTHTLLTLDAAKFEAYLAEEGLQRIQRLRAQQGATGQPGREAFRRCAKALIRIGDASTPTGHDHRIGCDLELVPETSPFALAPGDELAVQLLYQGLPQVDTRVNLFVQGHPGVHSFAVTDTQGRVRLPVADPGFHLISAVHMLPASGISGADWESIWASLTFRIPPQIEHPTGLDTRANVTP
jgi:uncharacterized GH25 family protein